MQLDSMKFSIAATSTVGLWYLICIIVVSIAPEMTIQLFGMMTHLINIDWMLENTKVTLTTGIIGFIEVTIYTFFTTYTFASIYNRLIK